MHLAFITRGVNQEMELFKMFMQSQMFNWKRKNLKTGKDELCQVQGSLRPMQLWEYVFPEECYDEVMTMLNRCSGAISGSLSNSKAAILRKALGKGFMKVPKYKTIPSNKYVSTNGIAIYPIGIKKDKRQEVKAWGYDQEML